MTAFDFAFGSVFPGTFGAGHYSSFDVRWTGAKESIKMPCYDEFVAMLKFEGGQQMSSLTAHHRWDTVMLELWLGTRPGMTITGPSFYVV